MRTAAKIFAFFALMGAFCNFVSASSSPFSAVLGYLPDIAVTDIHQESRFVYARVCNLGGTLSDSENMLVLGMRKAGGGVISLVVPVVLESDDCHEFQIASVDELGITVSGTYEIAAGAVLKDGRTERVKTNNKLTKTVNIIYPSTNAPTPSPTYYCNSASGNCSGSTYYCNSGNGSCYRDTYQGSHTYYCSPGNVSCFNNVPTYNNNPVYYRANICPSWDVACNNSYYNSTNTPYRDADNRYCTYANNYCNDYDRRRPDDYNNYNRPDLTVQRLYQDASNRHIIAQICNRGSDMSRSVSIRTSFVTNGTAANIYNTLQLSSGQCVDSPVYTNPSALNITSNGSYSVNVTIDADNNVGERDESNNTFVQYLSIETDQSQKPDLIVDRISFNENNRVISSRICNIGGDMPYYNNWTVEVANTTVSSLARTSWGGLAKGQCIEVTNSSSGLGTYQSGGYNFRVIVDPDNTVNERSEWNNTMNQYLQIWLGR